MKSRGKPDKKPEHLKDQAYLSIKNAIIAAQHGSDQRLVEEKISAQIGMSQVTAAWTPTDPFSST